MTAFNRDLAARIAETGIPLTADMVAHRFAPQHQSESDVKRRLPNCKQCGGQATDKAHDGDTTPSTRHLRMLINAQRPEAAS